MKNPKCMIDNDNCSTDMVSDLFDNKKYSDMCSTHYKELGREEVKQCNCGEYFIHLIGTEDQIRNMVKYHYNSSDYQTNFCIEEQFSIWRYCCFNAWKDKICISSQCEGINYSNMNLDNPKTLNPMFVCMNCKDKHFIAQNWARNSL